MTFFDPQIYCKQNLKEEDRKKLEFAETIAKDALEHAIGSVEDDYVAGLSETLDKIELEIIKSFAEEVKEQLGSILQEYVVGVIDNYEEEIEPVEDPETYYYVAGEDEEDDLFNDEMD